jgi:hypothetical protein
MRPRPLRPPLRLLELRLCEPLRERPLPLRDRLLLEDRDRLLLRPREVDERLPLRLLPDREDRRDEVERLLRLAPPLRLPLRLRVLPPLRRERVDPELRLLRLLATVRLLCRSVD